MRIETSSGEFFEATALSDANIRDTNRLLIELSEEVGVARAISLLNGNAWIRANYNDVPGKAITYDGYDRIKQITVGDNGRVRVVLIRGE